MAVNTKKLIESAATHGPSELDRLDYLDGWRGLAIGLVLYAHFMPKSGWLNSGRFGVDVFFCLSGFLMSNILFVRCVPLSTFYKRRISRICPVFLLFVVTIYLIGWYTTGSFSWIEFLSTASFLRTYIPLTPSIWLTPLPIGHMWSLNAEEHSYVFLSILTLLTFLKRREGWVLVGAGVLSIGIHVVYLKFPLLAPPSGDLGTEVVASHLLISAGYFLLRQRFVRFVQPWMPVGTFLGAMFCYTTLVPWYGSLLFSPFLLAFTVNHLSETPLLVRRALASPGIRLLGIWSYSIYIWQQPFYKFQDHFPFGGAFAAAMLVSLGSFYLFENPVRAWLNKNW